MPQPLYQYRLILPIDDDKMINVATDLDFNIEGEAKYTVAPNMVVKSNFVVRHSIHQCTFFPVLTIPCPFTLLERKPAAEWYIGA